MQIGVIGIVPQSVLLFRKPKRGLDHFLALFQVRFRRIGISRLQVGLSQFVLGSDVKRIEADGLFQVDDRRIQFPFVERQDSPELERFRGGVVDADTIVLQGDLRPRLPAVLTARGVVKVTVG